MLFVHNLDEKPREISFASGLPGDAGKLLVNLLSEDHSRANAGGRHKLLIEGYGYRWYRVGGLDYLLKRSDIDTEAGATTLIRPEPSSFRSLCAPMMTPSLPRRSSVSLIFSPFRSIRVESRISPARPMALDASETGSPPRLSRSYGRPSRRRR